MCIRDSGGEGSGIGEGGNWKTLSKNKVYFHTSYVMEYEEDSSWELVFKFEMEEHQKKADAMK